MSNNLDQSKDLKEEIIKLLKIIDKKYFKNEAQAIFLAEILLSYDLYDEFKEYSNDFDYKNIWINTKNNGYTINTLKFLALSLNLKKYIKYFNIFNKNKTHNDKSFIDEFIKILKYEFIIGDDNYKFNGVRWIKINKNNLNKIISQRIENISDELNLIINFESYIERLNKLVENNINYIKDELSDKSLIKNFEEIKDERRHIIGFDNGVLDLTNFYFRSGVPEDYLTLSCGYDYENFSKNSKAKKKLNNYIESLFNDKESVTDLYEQLSKILIGDNKICICNVWQGNKMSAILDLITNTFGNYAQLKKERCFNKLSPYDFSNMKGVRILMINELTEYNPSVFKQVLGSHIYGKNLRRKEFKFASQFTCIVTCKEIPFDSHDDSIKRRIRILEFKNSNQELKNSDDIKKIFIWTIFNYYENKMLNKSEFDNSIKLNEEDESFIIRLERKLKDGLVNENDYNYIKTSVLSKYDNVEKINDEETNDEETNDEETNDDEDFMLTDEDSEINRKEKKEIIRIEEFVERLEEIINDEETNDDEDFMWTDEDSEINRKEKNEFSRIKGFVERLEEIMKNSKNIASNTCNLDSLPCSVVQSNIEEKKNKYIDYQDSNLRTALINAVMKENDILVKILLEKDADINIKDKNGYDALYYSIKNENLDYIKMIINKKPSKNTIYDSNVTPIILLKTVYDEKIIKTVCEYFI
jgi:hypothetical protein